VIDFTETSPPGRLRMLLAKLVRPADDWAQAGSSRRHSSLLLLMFVLLGLLALAAFAGFQLAMLANNSEGLLGTLLVLLGLLGVAAIIVGLLMYQVRYHLLVPLAQLYAWALRMCTGDLAARIPTPQAGRFAKLTFHINRLSEALEKLANEMDDAVWAQTERLHHQNQSLETLYEIAATINTCDDLDELLEGATKRLMSTVDATSAVIRLRGDDGKLQVHKRVGFDDDGVTPGGNSSLAGKRDAALESQLQGDLVPDQVQIHNGSADSDDVTVMIVPLRYQQRVLGTLSLYSQGPMDKDNTEASKLFDNVGKHLGMAVAKARLDEESRKLSLMHERNSLAHELHDSLAQTLAGIGFQVRILAETLGDGEAPAAEREVVRIQNSLDEAHTELRELIANFRSPVDAMGVVPALEELTERFRKESRIATYLQIECPDLQLSPVSELQVLRIVREALNNVRKHSRAQTVRVLVRCESGGTYRILVEDDGVGIGEPAMDGNPGEHLGLSIMHERARRISGDLRIESEPGEGTRISLSFRTGDVSSMNEEHRRVS
jgi:two-component system nitrate/nitrite sensor histidine kinase NarX